MAALVQDAVPAVEAPQPRARFRWRVIPVAFFGLFAALGLVAGVGGIVERIWDTIVGVAPALSAGKLAVWILAEAGTIFVFGCASAYAAVALWKGKWRRGSVAAALAIGICGLLALLSYLRVQIPPH